MEMAQATAIFGWMLVINIALYTLAAVFIIFARDWVSNLQARITGISAEEWPAHLIDYLGRYKIAIIMLNLAPYLALKIVG